MDEKKPDFADLKSRLGSTPEELREFCQSVHTADLAEWLQDLDEDAVWTVFRALGAEDRAELLVYVPDALTEELAKGMGDQELVDVVQELQADDVADILALTDGPTTERILRSIDFERAQGLRELIHYPADTAGGMMTTEFVAVPEDTRIGDAIKEIKKQVATEEGPSGEEGLGIWVVDESYRPVGFVTDRDLLSHSIHDTVADVMETDIKTIEPQRDQEEVAQLFLKYGLDEVPVVDKSGALIGVVVEEYAREVIEEEAEEDIRKLVGTSPAEHTRLPILTRVRHRLPMQPLTVMGGLATAWILGKGLGSAGSETQVLTYIPLVIGLAGNVGIQSSTVLVRAYATGEVTREREGAVLGSEVLVGSIIGFLCGLGALLVASWIEGSPQFGLAVGFAISVAVSWASFLGSAVPILCQHWKIDPAIVAGPFLITLSDVSGSAIFLGVSHLLL